MVLDKETFKVIFDKCMVCDKAYSAEPDPYSGKVYTSTFNIEPKIIIRNFNQDSGFDDYGVHYMEIPDKEFDEFEKAWEYFQSVSCYRVMDNAGCIYAENLDEDYISEEVKKKIVKDEVLEVKEEVSQSYQSRKGDEQ